MKIKSRNIFNINVTELEKNFIDANGLFMVLFFFL